MQKKHRPSKSRTTCYVISDAARDTVWSVRDRLALLFRLTSARIHHNAVELDLSPEAQLQLFYDLCNELDRALREIVIRWPSGEAPPSRV